MPCPSTSVLHYRNGSWFNVIHWGDSSEQIYIFECSPKFLKCIQSWTEDAKSWTIYFYKQVLLHQLKFTLYSYCISQKSETFLTGQDQLIPKNFFSKMFAHAFLPCFIKSGAQITHNEKQHYIKSWSLLIYKFATELCWLQWHKLTYFVDGDQRNSATFKSLHSTKPGTERKRLFSYSFHQSCALRQPRAVWQTR